MTEPLTPAEIDDGWVAQPCGCAYNRGDTTTRDIGGGWTVTGSGWRQRWCQTHADEIERKRQALRARLFEAADQPTPNAMVRWLKRTP